MLAPVHRSLFLHPPPPPYAVCPGTFSKCHQKPAMLATGHRARFLRGKNRSRRHGRRRDLTRGMEKPTGCGTDEAVLASQQQRPAASAGHPALCPRPLGHHPGGPPRARRGQDAGAGEKSAHSALGICFKPLVQRPSGEATPQPALPQERRPASQAPRGLGAGAAGAGRAGAALPPGSPASPLAPALTGSCLLGDRGQTGPQRHDGFNTVLLR